MRAGWKENHKDVQEKVCLKCWWMGGERERERKKNKGDEEKKREDKHTKHTGP